MEPRRESRLYAPRSECRDRSRRSGSCQIAKALARKMCAFRVRAGRSFSRARFASRGESQRRGRRAQDSVRRANHPLTAKPGMPRSGQEKSRGRVGGPRAGAGRVRVVRGRRERVMRVLGRERLAGSHRPDRPSEHHSPTKTSARSHPGAVAGDHAAWKLKRTC